MTDDSRQLTESEWIDVSVPVFTGMVHWPDNPPVEVSFVMQLEHGDACNLSKLSLGVHTGTHMDAPLHFVANGQSIDHLPLNATIGRARVIEIKDQKAINVDELEEHNIHSGERILFKTSNSQRCWQTNEFVKDFVSIAPDAAQYLALQQICTVGVDYLSVGGFYGGGPETHRALLEAGIWVIEGLNLSQVQAGIYDLICLPLKLSGAEGAPARAILKPVTA
jgi:arylformamidase